MESIAGNLLTDVVRGVLGIVFTAVGSARLIHPASGVLGTAFNFFLIVGGVYLMIYLLIGRAQNRRAEPSKSFRLALREEAGFLLDEFEKIELWNSKADESERLDLLYPLSGNQFPGDVKQWKPLNKDAVRSPFPSPLPAVAERSHPRCA
jgi:hypothetical protein